MNSMNFALNDLYIKQNVLNVSNPYGLKSNIIFKLAYFKLIIEWMFFLYCIVKFCVYFPAPSQFGFGWLTVESSGPSTVAAAVTAAQFTKHATFCVPATWPIICKHAGTTLPTKSGNTSVALVKLVHCNCSLIFHYAMHLY